MSQLIPWSCGYFALMLVGSCAAPTKKISLTSEPPEASVYLNGKYLGLTELKSELEFKDKLKDSYKVILKKDGFEDAQATITYEPKDKTLYDFKLQKVEAVTVPLVSVEPTPSPKGAAELKITKKPTLAYLETIERSPSVAAATQITANQDNLVQIGAPVLSPTLDTMIYTEIVEEDGEGSYSNIIQQVPGEKAKTRVTFGTWLDLSPCFTKDGKSVVFGSNRTSANPTLWQVNLSGEGGIMKITGSLAHDFAPSVSCASGKIAYASLPPTAEARQIWTIEAGGSFPTQLREGDEPCISPDGKRLAFVRTDPTSKHKQLWLMSTEGGGETQLTPNLDYDVVDPRWSPDGSWIVYASDEGLDSRKHRNFDIWLVHPDGSGKMQLTTNGSRDDSPCWDRKGEHIYFRSNRGGLWNIWRVKPKL